MKNSIFIINKKKINILLFWILIFFTFFTPRDTLMLKKISLLVLIIFNIKTIIYGYRKSVYYTVFMLLLPIILAIVSVLLGSDIVPVISYLYIFLYLPLIFVVKKYNIDIKKICVTVINMMVALIVITCILDAFELVLIEENPIMLWLSWHAEAQISKSQYAMFYYVIFLKASPVILFNVMYYLKERKFVQVFIVLLAVMWTGTRANIFTATIIFVVYVLLMEENNLVRCSAAVVVLAVGIRYVPFLAERIETIYWAKSSGDEIRMASVKNIIEALNSDMSYWITGMGIDSEYFSGTERGVVVTSELSYLEFIRTCGIPLSFCTFYLWLKPIFILTKRKWWWLVMFLIAYITQGFVEPFIFTSTGFSVLMLVYALCEKVEGINQIEKEVNLKSKEV